MTTINGEDPAPPDMQATFIAHTPSGPTPCCVAHARKIGGLLRFLGAHVNFTKAPDGAQCENCVNEAKREQQP
jgi:hypothetical protein